MHSCIRQLFITALLLLLTMSTQAQETSSNNNFKEQFNGHFNYASRVLQLARAMPADLYDWRPMEGVSSVQKVYTHIASTNLYYLENNLGIPSPKGIERDEIESITGKEEVVAILEQSINHVKKAVQEMPESKLSARTELYGRTVNGQAVLMQLITHMSEHVGQSIAYARMNNIVPPWNK
ncbi:MAG: DinB family protein [Balneolaceae bacterium]|nr:DinB family protein [Balneolaceae bacterium]